MSLPDRVERILNTYYKTDTVNFAKIAKTPSKDILSLKGIGDSSLKNIAQEIEKTGIIKASEWLEGKILNTFVLPTLPPYINSYLKNINNIEELIIKKVNELNLMRRYDFNSKVKHRFAMKSDMLSVKFSTKLQAEVLMLKEILNHNRYISAIKVQRVFTLCHWDASIIMWIYMDENNISEDKHLLSLIPEKIKRSEKLIKSLGYDATFDIETLETIVI